jgi:hypothetical protein
MVWMPAVRSAKPACAALRGGCQLRVVGRRGRVLREHVQDVGDEQLLMLLLVIEPIPRMRGISGNVALSDRADQPLDRRIHMRPIGERPRRHPVA